MNRRSFLTAAAVASVPIPAIAAKPHKIDLEEWLKAQSLENVIDFHVSRLVKALNSSGKKHKYRAAVDYETNGFILIVEDRTA